MTSTSILLLFHLLISLIARIILSRDCLHYLEASQLVYDANRLTGFSVMGISIEGHFRAICKNNLFCKNFQQPTLLS